MEPSAQGPEHALEIDPLQRELLVEEAGAFRERLKDPEGKARYTELLSAVAADLRVPEHLLGALEDLLELGLQTGRLRRRYTAEGEQALLRLFQRTPRGAAVQEATREANRALEALEGQILRGVSFSARGPGTYGLALETDRGRFTLRIQRDGVWVENVEIEL
jgi:hypothetical protein